MLAEKRLLITGIVNRQSIAFATARAAQRLGAELVLSAFPRDRALTEEAAAGLDRAVPVIDADLTSSEDLASLEDSLREQLGGLDGALHAIAFAPREALAGEFLDAGYASVDLAFRTSAFSYASLARLLRNLAPEAGGSLVGLDFDAAGAWPVYNWMGVCKAALESINRYTARDLGPQGIRTNLVAAGPLHTRAAGGIPDFQRLLDAWESGSALPWDPADPEPVAETVCFLLSDHARAITGEILHADGGYGAMAGPIRQAAALGAALAA